MSTWEIRYCTSTGAVVVIDVEAEHRQDTTEFISLFGSPPGSPGQGLTEVWCGRQDAIMSMAEVHVDGQGGRRKGETKASLLSRTTTIVESLRVALEQLEHAEGTDRPVEPGQEYPTISPESIQISHYLDIAESNLAAANQAI